MADLPQESDSLFDIDVKLIEECLSKTDPSILKFLRIEHSSSLNKCNPTILHTIVLTSLLQLSSLSYPLFSLCCP